jgi:hypothetical protein
MILAPDTVNFTKALVAFPVCKVIGSYPVSLPDDHSASAPRAFSIGQFTSRNIARVNI